MKQDYKIYNWRSNKNTDGLVNRLASNLVILNQAHRVAWLIEQHAGSTSSDVKKIVHGVGNFLGGDVLPHHPTPLRCQLHDHHVHLMLGHKVYMKFMYMKFSFEPIEEKSNCSSHIVPPFMDVLFGVIHTRTLLENLLSVIVTHSSVLLTSPDIPARV